MLPFIVSPEFCQVEMSDFKIEIEPDLEPTIRIIGKAEPRVFIFYGSLDVLQSEDVETEGPGDTVREAELTFVVTVGGGENATTLRKSTKIHYWNPCVNSDQFRLVATELPDNREIDIGDP